MNKAELLGRMEQRFQQWQAFLDHIGPERMQQPGVNGNWSMKDMVAHLTGWNRWLVARIVAAQLGEPEPLPPWPAQLHGDDEINAWIYESNRQLPLGEILEDMRQVHQQLLAIIQDLPDDAHIEQIEPAYYLVWVGDKRFEVSEFFDHFYDDHEQDVRLWMVREGISQEE